MNHISVSETQPLAPYFGGKVRLAKHITKRIGDVPHKCYAEPFIGMGGVFLRRPFKARVEVINDINSEVTNLFRIIQNHYQPFMELMQYQLHSRAEFNRHLKTDPSTLTDLQRAVRFLYLQLCAYGGALRWQSFSVSANRGGKVNMKRLAPMIEKLHERITAIKIENLHYAEFITRYDTPNTLFYLDPPYMGNEKTYVEKGFTPDDFAKIAELMAGIKGRFILSINDTPAIRNLFARFNISEIDNLYTCNHKQKKVTELLIGN